MLYNAWPDTLNHLLEATRLTQATVAKNAGVSAQTISRWVGGRIHPKRIQLEKIAKGFAIPVARVGWVFGKMMARHYGEGAPQTNGSPFDDGDRSTDRPPSIEDRVQALFQHDLDDVAPELKSSLRAHRSELRNFVKDHRFQIGSNESRLESMIAVFEDMCEGATRVRSKT